MDTVQIIAQILGFVTVVLGFISFQVKTSKKLLLVQTLTCLVFSTHYYLIGAFPAAFMNMLGMVRNIVYYHKDKSFYRPKLFPIFFGVLMLIVGTLTANGPHSVLVISGLVINTVCLSMKNPQSIRKSVLFTCVLVLIYDVIEGSIGGIVYESVAIISAIIGLIRYRKVNE